MIVRNLSSGRASSRHMMKKKKPPGARIQAELLMLEGSWWPLLNDWFKQFFHSNRLKCFARKIDSLCIHFYSLFCMCFRADWLAEIIAVSRIVQICSGCRSNCQNTFHANWQISQWLRIERIFPTVELLIEKCVDGVRNVVESWVFSMVGFVGPRTPTALYSKRALLLLLLLLLYLKRDNDAQLRRSGPAVGLDPAIQIQSIRMVSPLDQSL